MNYGNLMKQTWESYENSADLLQDAISKLSAASQERLADHYGLSKNFKKQEITEEAAMALCEEAMACLAEKYPAHLEAFDQATNPNAALAELEAAEVVWQGEATIIKHFDADGEETAFLDSLREQTLDVIDRKIDAAAEACSSNASPENIALILGCLAVMDHIMGELGIPKSHEARQNLRKAAQDFVS